MHLDVLIEKWNNDHNELIRRVISAADRDSRVKKLAHMFSDVGLRKYIDPGRVSINSSSMSSFLWVLEGFELSIVDGDDYYCFTETIAPDGSVFSMKMVFTHFDHVCDDHMSVTEWECWSKCYPYQDPVVNELDITFDQFYDRCIEHAAEQEERAVEMDIALKALDSPVVT